MKEPKYDFADLRRRLSSSHPEDCDQCITNEEHEKRLKKDLEYSQVNGSRETNESHLSS